MPTKYLINDSISVLRVGIKNLSFETIWKHLPTFFETIELLLVTRKNDETLFFLWRNLSWFGAKSDFQNQYPAVWDKLLRPAVCFDGKNSNKSIFPPDFQILELLRHYAVEQIPRCI